MPPPPLFFGWCASPASVAFSHRPCRSVRLRLFRGACPPSREVGGRGSEGREEGRGGVDSLGPAVGPCRRPLRCPIFSSILILLVRHSGSPPPPVGTFPHVEAPARHFHVDLVGLVGCAPGFLGSPRARDTPGRWRRASLSHSGKGRLRATWHHSLLCSSPRGSGSTAGWSGLDDRCPSQGQPGLARRPLQGRWGGVPAGSSGRVLHSA